MCTYVDIRQGRYISKQNMLHSLKYNANVLTLRCLSTAENKMRSN